MWIAITTEKQTSNQGVKTLCSKGFLLSYQPPSALNSRLPGIITVLNPLLSCELNIPYCHSLLFLSEQFSPVAPSWTEWVEDILSAVVGWRVP